MQASSILKKVLFHRAVHDTCIFHFFAQIIVFAMSGTSSHKNWRWHAAKLYPSEARFDHLVSLLHDMSLLMEARAACWDVTIEDELDDFMVSLPEPIAKASESSVCGL